MMDVTDEEGPAMPKRRTRNHEGAETTQLAFRLSNDLIARIDKHVARMNADHPGLGATRVDAVRSLLTRALSGVDELRAAREARRGIAETLLAFLNDRRTEKLDAKNRNRIRVAFYMAGAGADD